MAAKKKTQETPEPPPMPEGFHPRPFDQLPPELYGEVRKAGEEGEFGLKAAAANAAAEAAAEDTEE